MKHQDCTLDEILNELVNNNDFCRELDIVELSKEEKIDFLKSSYNEEDIREFFDELVQFGAKKLKDAHKGRTFKNSI